MSIKSRNKTGAQPKPEGHGFRCLRALLVRWFSKFGRDLPWRHDRNAYGVLVSEIMLQHAPAEVVMEAFEGWLKRYPDFKSVSAAPGTEIVKAWQELGFPSGGRNLHAASTEIVELHGGEMPNDLDLIQNLPGLDDYTARMVATLAFDEPTPVLDANIARVLARLRNSRAPIDSAEGQKALWQMAIKMQADKKAEGAGAFNEALIELGDLVCVEGKPKCSLCPVCGLCKATNPERITAKASALPQRQANPAKKEDSIPLVQALN